MKYIKEYLNKIEEINNDKTLREEFKQQLINNHIKYIRDFIKSDEDHLIRMNKINEDHKIFNDTNNRMLKELN